MENGGKSKCRKAPMQADRITKTRPILIILCPKLSGRCKCSVWRVFSGSNATPAHIFPCIFSLHFLYFLYDSWISAKYHEDEKWILGPYYLNRSNGSIVSCFFFICFAAVVALVAVVVHVRTTDKLCEICL